MYHGKKEQTNKSSILGPEANSIGLGVLFKTKSIQNILTNYLPSTPFNGLPFNFGYMCLFDNSFIIVSIEKIER